MRHSYFRAALTAIVLTVPAMPAAAQTVHALQLGAGLFMPRGLDGRDAATDVLARNALGVALPRYPTLSDALEFSFGEFRGGQVSGEWDVAFGPHVEVGLGLAYYADAVPSRYRDLVDERGRDVEQRLGLRVVPLTGLVRFLPFGGFGTVQPYVGGGVSLLMFRYSERGEFIDSNTLDIFSESYRASGTTVGGVLLGGLRLPIGGDVYGMGIEGRYQYGKGDTGGERNKLLADRIDLSGASLNVSFLVRF